MTTRISTLPSLAAVTDATIIPVVEGGATKRITGLALKTYTGTAAGPSGPSGPAGSAGASGPSGPSGPGTLNSGTAGYVPYYSGSTTLSAPTSGNLYWDNSNVRLGIGTASPAVSVEISKSSGEALRLSATGANQNIYSRYITGSPGVGNFYVGVDSAAGGLTGVGSAGHIWNAGNAGIAIGTNNTLRVVVDASGSVGLGETSPSTSATRLVVNPPYPPSGAGYLPAMKIFGGFDNQGSQDNAAVVLQYGGGQVPGGSLLTARTGQHTAFVLNNNGSDNNLHAAGGRPNVYIYSGPNFNSYGQPNSAVYASGYQSRMGIYSEMTGMYDGSALTGLSITLAGSYGGNSTRDVMCSAVRSTTNFGSDKGYGTSYGYWANISSNSTANYAFFASAGDAAKPGGGSWASSSDARVKTVIGDYARGLADVVQLHVVDFQYNGRADTPTDGRTYTGLIAQEAIEVMPEMVHTRNAKLDPEDTSETAVYMVDNSALVYALVNSVKELKSLVDAQAARIAQLEGN